MWRLSDNVWWTGYDRSDWDDPAVGFYVVLDNDAALVAAVAAVPVVMTPLPDERVIDSDELTIPVVLGLQLIRWGSAPVCVMCMEGVNRSPRVAIALHALADGVSVWDAYDRAVGMNPGVVIGASAVEAVAAVVDRLKGRQGWISTAARRAAIHWSG